MLLGFKKQFVPMILSHLKTHTIRAKRKRPPRVGEICHCYTGLRQKGARLLGRWPCVKVDTVTIGLGVLDRSRLHVWPVVYVGDSKLSPDECEALARSDGFRSFAEMMEFWRGRLPFRGYMIHWDPTKPAAGLAPSSTRRQPVFKSKKRSA